MASRYLVDPLLRYASTHQSSSATLLFTVYVNGTSTSALVPTTMGLPLLMTTFENEMSPSAACAAGAVRPMPTSAMPPDTATAATRRTVAGLFRCTAADFAVINPHP